MSGLRKHDTVSNVVAGQRFVIGLKSPEALQKSYFLTCVKIAL